MLIGVLSQYDLLVVDNWEKSIQEINNPCQLERASLRKKDNSLHYREQILYIVKDMHILVTYTHIYIYVFKQIPLLK